MNNVYFTVDGIYRLHCLWESTWNFIIDTTVTHCKAGSGRVYSIPVHRPRFAICIEIIKLQRPIFHLLGFCSLGCLRVGVVVITRINGNITVALRLLWVVSMTVILCRPLRLPTFIIRMQRSDFEALRFDVIIHHVIAVDNGIAVRIIQ